MAALTSGERVQQIVGELNRRAQQRLDNVNKRLEAVDTNKKHLLLTVATTVEVAGTAFAFGYIRAYYGEKSWLKLPIEAWAAIICHGIGLYFDLTAKGGNQAELRRIVGMQFHNVGNGALAALLTTLGAEMGANALSSKQQAPQQLAASGALTGAPTPPQFGPGRMQMPLSQQELDTMAANI
ncbi:MAG: hypothetical protein E6Q97_20485 [Desulfurellales bacterium]|nr:MAG: hypothetical protein E6Q97_20485 [Desulfurellales bacterium]